MRDCERNEWCLKCTCFDPVSAELPVFGPLPRLQQPWSVAENFFGHNPPDCALHKLLMSACNHPHRLHAMMPLMKSSHVIPCIDGH